MIIEDLSTVPHFGFGLMRLPVLDADDKTSIDYEQLNHMIDAFLDAGFTYFDTAYPYHGGWSERAVKECLVKRHDRESFLLADKMPAWSLKQPGDVERIFAEQLERTGAGFFDFYLLHSVESQWYPVYTEYGCWEWAQRMKDQGLIRHFGFSYHDGPELLDLVLTEHPEVEFVQLQLNYLDWENPVVRSRENYEVCRRHGVHVTVMEPVKGGTLAELPEAQHELLQAVRPGASDASWAVRFALDRPGMLVVLSGMSDEAQMADNLATVHNLEPLSEAERDAIGEVTRQLLDKPTIGCTACRYCVDGCPMQIEIPELFRAMNAATLYGNGMRPRGHYKQATSGDHGRASDCIACGACAMSCPQHLPIPDLLVQVAQEFDGE
ncbi:MAG: aldo/keto reductase [Atopobiaceae bacterium]|nr:aldo/keto reductase [Atopobiaceae bacterium]